MKPSSQSPNLSCLGAPRTVRTLGLLAALGWLTVAITSAAAQELVDDAPLPHNGNVQFVAFDSQDPFEPPADGRVISLAFGGPEQLPPPDTEVSDLDFSEIFELDSFNGYYRVKAEYRGVRDVLPAYPNDLRDCWVYVYAVDNDGGIDATSESDVFFRFEQGLDPDLLNLPNSVIEMPGGIRGSYIYGYGETELGPGNVNASSLELSPFRASLAANFATGIPDGGRSEVYFIYSPFAPANFSSILLGANRGESLAVQLSRRFHAPRFWPELTCEIGSLPPEMLPGESATFQVTFANTPMALGIVPAGPPSDPPLGGYELRNHDASGPYPRDRVRVTVDSNSGDLGCGTFRFQGRSLRFPMTRSISVQRGTTRRARLELEIAPDFCDRGECDAQADFAVVLQAESPYDADPPFEAWPNPAIDADPDDDASAYAFFPVYCGAFGAIACIAEVSNDGMTFGPQTPAEPGEDVWFRVTVQNAGDRDIDSFSLIDVLPAGLVNVAVIDGPGCGVVGNGIDCPDLGPLPEAADRTILYRATVDAPVGTRLVTFVSVEGRFPRGEVVTSECSVAIDVE